MQKPAGEEPDHGKIYRTGNTQQDKGRRARKEESGRTGSASGVTNRSRERAGRANVCDKGEAWNCWRVKQVSEVSME